MGVELKSYYHGTRSDHAVGEKLSAGGESNYALQTPATHSYFTDDLEAATWQAELSNGNGSPTIYLVDPVGLFEDNPNPALQDLVTYPSKLYRSLHPVTVSGRVETLQLHKEFEVAAMAERILKYKSST